MKALILMACVVAATGCSTMTKKTIEVKPGQAPQTAEKLDRKVTKNVKVEYLLFLPRDYKAKSESPLILFLHGAGERGTNVWKAGFHGPSKYIAKHPEFPFIVVTPLCPPDQRWSNETLMSLLDEVTTKYKVNTKRVYVTGLSMGGFGTWNLGTTHPERFAAIAPICGGGEIITILLTGFNTTKTLKTLPVWAFHGAKDTVVPLVESERMVEAMKRIGNKGIKLTVYPDAQHDSWTETYSNPELYDWFLQHELKK